LWLYTTDLRPRATECPKLLPPNFRVTSSSDVRSHIHKGLTRHTHCAEGCNRWGRPGDDALPMQLLKRSGLGGAR